MEKEIELLYFTITEVSKQVKVPASQIRYWTSYFKIYSKERRAGMNRKYTKEDIQKLIRIKSLADTRYFTLLGMKRILAGVITFKYKNRGQMKEITPDSIFENNGAPSKVEWNSLT